MVSIRIISEQKTNPKVPFAKGGRPYHVSPIEWSRLNPAARREERKRWKEEHTENVLQHGEDFARLEVENYIKAHAGEMKADAGPFASSMFSLAKVQASDPRLAKVIKLMAGKDLKKSNLLFDGDKLHWKIGEQIIYSWTASSGKLEGRTGITNTQLYAGEVQNDFYDIFKILSSGKEKEQKVRDIMKIFAPAKVSREDVDDILSAWNRFTTARLVIKSLERSADAERFGDEPSPVDSFVQKGLRFLKTDEDNVREVHTEAGKRIKTLIIKQLRDPAKYGRRRAQARDPKIRNKHSSVRSKGPIPEGYYVLSHSLQDMSNDGSARLGEFVGLHSALAITAKFGPNPKKGDERVAKYAKEMEKFYEDFGVTVRDEDELYDTRAWGRFRVRISKASSPAKAAIRHGAGYNYRDGFFIHGADQPGSSGCINLEDGMESFARFWVLSGVSKIMGGVTKMSKLKFDAAGRQEVKQRIPLVVSYNEKAKQELKQNNPMASDKPNVIFDDNQ